VFSDAFPAGSPNPQEFLAVYSAMISLAKTVRQSLDEARILSDRVSPPVRRTIEHIDQTLVKLVELVDNLDMAESKHGFG